MNEIKEPRKPLIYYYLIVFLAIMLFNALLMPIIAERQIKEVDYSTFMQMVEEGKVDKAEVSETENSILFSDHDEAVYRTGMIQDPDLIERLTGAGVSFTGEIIQQASPILSFLLTWVLPFVILGLIGRAVSKKVAQQAGGGKNALSFGESNARVYVPSEEGIRFSDVAGVDEAKESLAEIVDYLHNPERYREVGAKMPKGVLLVGPPGTGKTMLAKALAGEAKVPFFSISGSEFVQMFVGMGAHKVRDLFKQAKEKAPCIVFIDEIDAIGQSRSGRLSTNDEREQTLNQLLTEMDGFEDNTGVIILAATNRPESLDPALLRPGRFDRRVNVELPDLQGREAILKVHASKVNTDPNINYTQVARMASGASGADLANIINEGALCAVREGRKIVTQEDLEESIEVVIAGQIKKNAIMTEKEKRIVAYHEIGHALVAAEQTHTAPVQKITIVPRTSGALGYTMQVQEEDRYLLSKTELENHIATLTGGRAAEELIFGSITTGVSNDIEKATEIARSMVTRYGMDENFGMVALEKQDSQYLGGGSTTTCSAETQKHIDKAVVNIIREQYDKAFNILSENRTKLEELADHLFEKETITGEEFME
ncbi:MAG TPA: ATP-dependent zinc metalloprotease FtsH, partial [Fastidiosipila sp.]|nr:ATP-dependent zinc metalloprotease FtsH [Fastidiosipila sp.]